ncbi:MAG: penicillin acylase family protein, partial [Pseudomonadales bacterium]|nr:penicillin acylase family protein [Pseudomonadales bacterium]
NICYQPAGLAPIRDNYDGLLPVPGDGRYEWQDYYDMDLLPVEENPDRGWVATANAMSLPPDYPYKARKLGFEWANPWRIDRISEVLEGTNRHSMQDSIDLQRDYLSIPARRILDALNINDLPVPAAGLFADWDFRLTRDSGAAALFEIWWSRHFKDAVMQRILDIQDITNLGEPDGLVVVESFEAMDEAQRQLIAGESLQDALATAAELMGQNIADWSWGGLHKMKFRHPLLDFVDGETRALLAIPEVSRGGSGDTPNSTRYARDFSVVSGASWRMVLDVGNWDNAFMTNAPGQSGDPRSPHYDDLLDNWASDGKLPLVYSREAVERNADERIILIPARRE